MNICDVGHRGKAAWRPGLETGALLSNAPSPSPEPLRVRGLEGSQGRFDLTDKTSPCQLHASPACSPVPYVASPDRHFSTMIRRLGCSGFLFSPAAPPRQSAPPAAGNRDRQ